MAESAARELAHWAEAPVGRWARGLDVAVRVGALPVMLGLRLAGWTGPARRDRLPTAPTSLALAGKVALDELFFCTELASAPVVALADRGRLARELTGALRLFERRGWLDDPASYHRDPPPIRDARLHGHPSPWGRLRSLSFESGYAPNPDEPGRARWLGYAPNRTAHAWLLEHAGPPRPWLVCVPGYRMGSALADFVGFRVPWVHRRLGLNVAIPVLPLHGPRRVGRRGGDGFLRGDFVDTVHAQAQAVWDVRRLVDWLRAEGAPAIGAHGISLGGYTAALLAALEPRLGGVIAGVPATSFTRLLRGHAPRPALGLLERLGVDFAELDALLRPVAPLALAPRVEHLSIYAGVADRLATADHALDLWHHWGRPPITWYAGSHVSFLFEDGVKRHLRTNLVRTGLVAARRPAAAPTPAP